MDKLWIEIRYALRMLYKARSATFPAIIALAVGIGATTAIFTVVNAVLLKPFGFQDADRLVVIWESAPSQGYDEIPVSPADYMDWRAQSSVFEELAAFEERKVSLRQAEGSEQVDAAAVTPQFFSLLGVGAQTGRPLLEEDGLESSERVVVLSHPYWQSRFGGASNALGQTIQLDGEAHTVVGVLPASFRFPALRHASLWVPLAFDAEILANRMDFYLSAIGRLKDGVSLKQAQEQMAGISKRLDAEVRPPGAEIGVVLNSLRGELMKNVESTFRLLVLASLLLLLVACANVANLLVVRSSRRAAELGLRAALGASRAQLARMMVLESLVLGVAGGVLGLLLAAFGTRYLVALSPVNLPRLDEISLDHRVLLFTLGVALISGLAFGLLPALTSSRTDLRSLLNDGEVRGTSSGKAQMKTRAFLVVAEVGLALLLLVGCGLMVRSFLMLQDVDPGFEPQQLAMLPMELTENRYPTSASRLQFVERVLEAAATQPGVEEAAVVSDIQLAGSGSVKVFTLEGRPVETMDQLQPVDFRQVSAGYFSTLKIPIATGRSFNSTDRDDGQKVAVVNETFVQRFLSGEEAVGKRLRLVPPAHLLPEELQGIDFPWVTIVGVAGDVHFSGPSSEPEPEILVPFLQELEDLEQAYLVVRSNQQPTGLLGSLRATVARVDSQMPVEELLSVQALVDEAVAPTRFVMYLLSIFGISALVLAAVGLYGVMSYSVGQRQRELGLRMALGANRGTLLKMILRQGLVLCAVGVVCGAIAAAIGTRFMSSLLFGVSPGDPLTVVLAAVVLFAVATLAVLLPAVRATSVSPTESLRNS
ncbi:MAG: ABC transporter permease [Deltaproteobacteria bacterium]|nr:ABC transporter permease [Deltaproteobacteria bacterium]